MSHNEIHVSTSEEAYAFSLTTKTFKESSSFLAKQNGTGKTNVFSIQLAYKAKFYLF